MRAQHVRGHRDYDGPLPLGSMEALTRSLRAWSDAAREFGISLPPSPIREADQNPHPSPSTGETRETP